MIGIRQNLELTRQDLSTAEKAHFDIIKEMVHVKTYTKKNNLKKDNGKLWFDFIKCLEKNKFSLKMLICSEYSKLKKMHTDINEILQSEFSQSAVKKLKKLMTSLYSEYRKLHGLNFVERLKLSVCPYCNRNFINNGKTTSAQFDHFFPKDEYPLLAVSFYNLIPCCYSCNLKKRNDGELMSPYDEKCIADDIIEFKYEPTFSKEKGRGKRIVIAAADILKENVKQLQLEELYQIHTDVVDELEYKVKAYSDRYIEMIYGKVSEEFRMSKKEIYYGNYLEQENYYRRPLSKFTHDIIEYIEELTDEG